MIKHITRLEQKIFNLKSMGPSSSRDVFAMMTKMFDEIKTGDIVDLEALAQRLWRHVAKTNR